MYNLPKTVMQVWSVDMICKNVIMIYICVFQTAIAVYIRLFEPLMIKVLKQYTVTSFLELQQQVLDLLSQLVQLWVNYHSPIGTLHRKLRLAEDMIQTLIDTRYNVAACDFV